MTYRILALCAILLPGLPASAAMATAPLPALLTATTAMSLKQAISHIKQQSGGRILSAKTVSERGQALHKIKVLLPSGKVRVFRIPAR